LNPKYQAPLTIKSISWHHTMDIRHKVLWPNKPVEHCKVSGDETALHYGGFIEGKLVSVISVYIDARQARFRKFATIQSFQGQGIGSQMLNHVMSAMKAYSVTRLWCDARESAIGFYTQFGMTPYGQRFYKSDLTYFKMAIDLS